MVDLLGDLERLEIVSRVLLELTNHMNLNDKVKRLKLFVIVVMFSYIDNLRHKHIKAEDVGRLFDELSFDYCRQAA